MFYTLLKFSGRKLLLVLIMVVFHGTAFSANSGANSGSDKQQVDIEVIEVIGNRPLSFYRKNHFKAQNIFFNTMNDLVDDDDFKVDCGRVRSGTFSRLTVRACDARFVSRIRGERTQQKLDLMSRQAMENPPGDTSAIRLPNNFSTQKILKKKQVEHAEMLVELIKENSGLRQAYFELVQAKNAYESKK